MSQEIEILAYKKLLAFLQYPSAVPLKEVGFLSKTIKARFFRLAGPTDEEEQLCSASTRSIPRSGLDCNIKFNNSVGHHPGRELGNDLLLPKI